MHWRKMIDKSYLGSYDMTDGAGSPKDYTLTVARVDSVAVQSRESPKGKRKVVITFERAEKKFIANVTCCEVIESLYGPDTTKWVGQKLTLYQTLVRSPKGGQIPGIRIRPKKPSGDSEAIVAKPVDEEMRAAQDEAFGRGGNADDY